MKITQILYSGLGGHGSVAFSIIAGDKENAAKHSLIFVGIEPLLDEYAATCEASKIDYKYLVAKEGKPWRHWHPLYRQLVKQDPDAVILHSTTSILPATLYAFLRRKILIAVEHTPNHQKTKGERMMSWVSSLVADRVVVLTERYRDELSGGFARARFRKRVVVIPNGVDSDVFSGSGDHYGKTDMRIGMAARLSASKRQDILIRSMKSLSDLEPHNDWTLSIAGDGDQATALKSLAEELDLGERVTFEGHLQENELVDWFNSLDIYVHSSDGEALSTSMLQAMSMGLPIVGTDVPGISNLLRSDIGDLGLLVSNGRPDLLAESIHRLTLDEELYRKLSRNARKAVEQRYNHVAMFDSYNEVVRNQLLK